MQRASPSRRVHSGEPARSRCRLQSDGFRIYVSREWQITSSTAAGIRAPDKVVRPLSSRGSAFRGRGYPRTTFVGHNATPFPTRKAHLVPPISTRAEMASIDSNSNGRQTDGESVDPPGDPAPACRPAEGMADVKHAGKEPIGNRHKSSGNSAGPTRSRSQSSNH
ncbi:hypothetical protein MRX96_029995 [Rhipicephalus microplus]